VSKQPPIGSLYAYLYSKEQINDCGDYYYCSEKCQKELYQIEKGIWYTITYKIECNDLNTKNGSIKMFVNGKQVFYENEMELIPETCPDSEKNWVFQFSVFRGGSSNDWSVLSNNDDSNQKIYFSFLNIVNDPSLLYYPIQETYKICSLLNQTLG
jgi:hypothetical protein